MGVLKKKLDVRIRTLIENGVQRNERTLFVLVGDNGKDQVANIYYIFSKILETNSPPVLWCYKSDLGFSSNKQKRMKSIKKMVSKGLFDTQTDDPFELFISSTTVRWIYYKDTHKVLGNTYGMCVLQDFEAITPNLLAQTIETVQGGGIIIFLLRTMTSLKQLYNLNMDVHSRFTTESHSEIKARFNERFLLSLSQCYTCMVMDDELNILNISRSVKDIKPVPKKTIIGTDSEELKKIKLELVDSEIVGDLISRARTVDQVKAILTFIDAISEKTLNSTVTLTAARGRGKSASLGLAIAAAIAFGYSNIFVTSPSPENLKTLFEFVFKGFDSLKMKEHEEYELIQSTNPAWNNCIVRVNVFKTHRQTIQYIVPTDHIKLGQAELVVIDEAAAIPLPHVKALLGPYLVFMASTTNGYEGTGRSLSLKLIKQLKEESNTQSLSDNNNNIGSRSLRQVTLDEPIRYAKDDPVESWLNHLLCLDATIVKNIASGCPHPSQCDLYYVNRDTLFSYHKASEAFLQRMMAMYVSSHYKNSPNDLQLMADAPAHHLFVLLPPVSQNSHSLPEILCVVQVSLEGSISSQSVRNASSRGQRAAGDLIPWTISQQFQDENFPSLFGARIVRIATHPDYMGMGYGSRVLELLKGYYMGQFSDIDSDIQIDENMDDQSCNDDDNNTNANGKSSDINNNNNNNSIFSEIEPRKNLPSLLLRLSERPCEKLDYIGVSFGLTNKLFKFWKKAHFVPLYFRLTPNPLTGEHTMIMLHQNNNIKMLKSNLSPNWLSLFNRDFRERFMTLLSFDFRELKCEIALNILKVVVEENRDTEYQSNKESEIITQEELETVFSSYDFKRLQAYAYNLLDYHVIIDLLPKLALLYFNNRFGTQLKLSIDQQLFLAGLGLQHKTLESISSELNLEVSQILAYFNKVIRRFVKLFKTMEESAEMKKIRDSKTLTATNLPSGPILNTLDQELEKAKIASSKDLESKNINFLNISMNQYAIHATDQDWEAAPLSKDPKLGESVSVKLSSNDTENDRKRSYKHSSDKSGAKSKKRRT